MQVHLQNCKKQASKAIVKELALNENRPPKLTLTGLRVIDHPNLQDALVKFEKSEVFKRFKFGVMVVKEGQTKDDQYFSNGMAHSSGDTPLGLLLTLLQLTVATGGTSSSQ